MVRCFVAVFLGFCFSLGAQPGFVTGYIVNAKGDTVRGETRYNPKKEFENYYKVTFRDHAGQQKIYKPEKVKGFGVRDTHYVSITENEETLFYRVLARGEITFYRFMYEGLRMNKPYFVPEYYLRVPDKESLVLVKENKFKRQMEEWMDDNTALLDSFPESKEFDPVKATGLINQYNAWKATHKK